MFLDIQGVSVYTGCFWIYRVFLYIQGVPVYTGRIIWICRVNMDVQGESGYTEAFLNARYF